METLLLVLPICAIAYGFTNIGIVSFRLDLDFAKDFRFGVYQRIGGSIIMITLAIVLRNYWALVIGVISLKVVGLFLSYTMSDYRPHFSLKKLREIWGFSIWMLVVYVSEYLARRIDQFVVGSSSNSSIMGAYSVGADLAQAPAIDVVQPVMRALFPVYSRLLNDPERLKVAVLQVVASGATICFAAGFGVAAIAREFTAIVLGPQWDEATPLIFWLAIGSIPVGLNYCIYTVLSVTNHARLTAVALWARIIVLVPAMIIAMHLGGAQTVAKGQAFVGFVVLAVDFFMLAKVIEISLLDIIRCLNRAVLAACAMLAALSWLDANVHAPTSAMLFLKIAFGATIYVSLDLLMWLLSGRPAGIEALAIRTLKTLRPTLS